MQRLAEAVAAGVDWLQIRDRALAGAALLELAEAAGAAGRQAARRAGRPLELWLNRRLDVALALGADGVQLGFDALEPTEARRLLGPRARIGVSCHAPQEVAAAREASHAQLAPIFPPLSKALQRPALGPQALRAAAAAGLPLLAQGGVTPANAGACIAAGAAGVVVTGAIWQAPDTGAAASALRAALDAAGGQP